MLLTKKKRGGGTTKLEQQPVERERGRETATKTTAGQASASPVDVPQGLQHRKGPAEVEDHLIPVISTS